MFKRVLHSPALWLGMLVLNAESYFKSDDVLMVILSVIGIFSSAYLYEKNKPSKVIVILEKEND
ncbi:hypothetical protein [Mannheimia indoligenes]|uniref:hypothetical protein n=1 Tax=Mannheimia indoligenes TaxID=3103145 RepID=UPI002FE5D1D3